MASSNVDIANQALARLGEPAIAAFTDDTDAAEKVSLLYEPTILGLLSAYAWDFATARTALSIDGSAPAASGWQRGFLLPSLRTVRVGKPLGFWRSIAGGARILRYEVAGKWVFCDELTIWCSYVERTVEAEWPGYFEILAVEALAAKLALPITETQTKAEHHQGVAFGTPGQGGRGGLFKAATDADAVGAVSESILDDDDPIASARFG